MSVAITKGGESLPISSFPKPMVEGVHLKSMAKPNGGDLEELYVDGFLVTLYVASREFLGESHQICL